MGGENSLHVANDFYYNAVLFFFTFSFHRFCSLLSGMVLPLLSTLVLAMLLLGREKSVLAYSKSKRHTHDGVLTPYNGKHIPYQLTLEQLQKIKSGAPVLINERNGKSGRGIVIQDIHASPDICVAAIADLSNYPNVVPSIKKIEIYSNQTFNNGTTQVGALFQVGISLLTFGYYLLLTHEPKYNTFTWTLDYQFSSDFEDNTGHWQVMPHPSKEGWSRVLYSCEVKLYSWVPEFVITFLTKTALVESTSWVKREAEKTQLTMKSSSSPSQINAMPDLSACYKEDADGARYTTECSEMPPSSSSSSAAAAAPHAPDAPKNDLDTSEAEPSSSEHEDL